MPATVEQDGLTTPIDLSGGIYSFFPGPEPFEQAHDFLIRGGVGSASSAVAWSFGAGAAETGGVIGLRGPRAVGDIVEVSTGTFQPTYAGDPYVWGSTVLSASAASEATLKARDFDASQASGGTVSGTLTVLAIRPVRLLVDLLALDPGGQELRLRGEMRFEAGSTACP
jgi:hypothetical protein